MSSVGKILGGYHAPQADQEAFHKDLHQHPGFSHAERRRALRLRIGAGALYGVVAGSPRAPSPSAACRSAPWSGAPTTCPAVAGIYQPIWEYGAKTLARDLSARLAYGTGTGTTFWLITRIW